ncbi:alpha/beta fold hydrolase [Niallia endozanthoxylica]|uniref:Alpha/beta hydrolase n=1 Tax=Niallia endozanthoxylica TaxID=2036016 RepID=A0A5J5HV28_9BACI|nr:alpha/beta hydrolase [Niallia endozanthoxylica]KAA9025777.1 alpha/beta hydrolase [Niallia endozanthoxylica]
MAEFLYEKTRIVYDISGEGIPIIFIHPPAMGRVVFRCQEDLNRHFTVIIPDLSGTGDSIGPEHKVTIDGYAKEVKALLEYLNIKKAVICGYSAGGCVAQEFVLRFPEMSLGLILISGYSEVQSLGFKYEHLAGMYFAKKFPSFLRYVISSAHTDQSSYRDDINRHMKKANRKMWMEFYEQSLYFNCTERLSEISVPLLLMYGSRDFTNQHLQTYEKLTNQQAVIFPNVSHQLPTKKSQLVNQTITGFIIENIEKSH